MEASAPNLAALDVGDNLELLGSDALVSFRVRRLAHPTIVWLNERWFSGRLNRPFSGDIRIYVEKWLIDSFAFCVPLPGDPAGAFKLEEATFYADRYGDDGYTPHGGSGRVATTGKFQIKGIGVTPLAGSDADWLHRNGCLWLEEALREVIIGEVLAAELPLGAAPILAVIDTGLTYGDGQYAAGTARALLIRPSYYRLAHLQRAPLFRPLAADRKREQLADARRTMDAVRTLAPTPEKCEDWLGRAAQQLGYAYARGLYLGGMLPSNWNTRGQVLDFGSVTAVGLDGRYAVVPGLPPFGNEGVAIEEAFVAIYRRASRRYSDWRKSDCHAVITQFRLAQSRFADRYSIPVGSAADSAVDARPPKTPNQPCPRPILMRRVLQTWINEQSKLCDSRRSMPNWAAPLVQAAQTFARRDWHHIPADSSVIAQCVGSDTSLVVYAADESLWLGIEGATRKGCADILQGCVGAHNVVAEGRDDLRSTWWLRVQISSDFQLSGVASWFLYSTYRYGITETGVSSALSAANSASDFSLFRS